MNAFFIDADILCGPAAIDEAFQALQKLAGTIHVRRAYGNAEKLQALAETFRTNAIRLYPNLCIKKNTTDIALSVDLMEMACGALKPEMVAIGSADMDFAPLVVRLRERGIKVGCSEYPTRSSKPEREMSSVFDTFQFTFIFLELRQGTS